MSISDGSAQERHERVSALFAEVYEQPREVREAQLAASSDPAIADEVRALLARVPDETAEGDPFGKAVARAAGRVLDEELEVVPDVIGPFRIVRVIGRGGMGVVYEAIQEQPRRRVAVKVMRPGYATQEVARRFESEAEVLAQLTHPDIAQVYVAGTAKTIFGVQPYLAMALVEGVPLDEAADAMPRRERTRLVARIARAVHHAHLRGVIHRDLKPGNVLVQADGAPKVLDFGIARLVDTDRDGTLTNAGQVLGTLAYASPEQLAGRPGSVDIRADVYSLGVMLYELLSGGLPIVVSDTPLPDAIRRVSEDDPIPLGRRDPALRGDLQTITAKAIAKRPEERYGSAQALADDLERYLSNRPIEARPPGALYVLRKFVRRNLPLVVAGAAVLVALIGGLLLALASAQRAEVARTSAERSSDRANLMSASSSLRLGDVERVRGALGAVPSDRRDWAWQMLEARVDDSIAHFPTDRQYVAAYPLGTSVRVIERMPGADDYEVKELDALSGAILRSAALPGLPLVNTSGTHAALHRGREYYAVCDLATGEIVWRVPRAEGHRILGFRVDPTGRYVVVHGQPHWAQVYEVGRDEPLCRVDLEREGMPLPPQIAGTGEDLKVAAAYRSQSVLVFDYRGELLWEGEAGVDRPRVVAFDRDGGRLAVLGSAGTWSIVDAARGHVLVKGRRYAGALHQIAFANDDRRVITLDDRGGLQIWDGEAGNLIEVLRGQRGAFLAESIGVASGQVATVAVDGSARLWDVDPRRSRRTRRLHESWGTGFSLRADDRLGVSTSYDGTIVVVDAGTLEPLARYRLPEGFVSWQARWMDEATVVVLGVRYGRHHLALLDLLTGTTLAHVPVTEETLPEIADRGELDLCYDADRGVLYVSGVSLDPRTLQRMPRQGRPTTEGFLGRPISVSKDGRYLVGGDPLLRRVTVATGEAKAVEPADHVVRRWAQVLNEAGTRLAAVYADGTLRVWDTATWTRLVSRTAHGARALSVAWHPNGRHLVTGGDAGPIAVWDAHTFDHVVDLPAHTAYVRTLTFSREGVLFTSCGDGSVGRFDARRTRERSTSSRSFAEALVAAAVWLDGKRGLTARSALEAARADPTVGADLTHAVQCELMRRASLAVMGPLFEADRR